MHVVLMVLAVLVVVEIVALLWLATSVGRYKDFWEAKADQPGDITYLALGDSAAQGIGASSPMKGYVGLIAKRLEDQTGKSVRIVNYSRTGATMRNYLKEQAPRIDQVSADIVTIEIGANDVSSFDPDAFREDFRNVLETLPSGSYVANMPLFNSRLGSTENGKQASKIVESELQQFDELRLVDLQKQTSQNQTIFGFAPDLFHPNNISYKHWADAFWQEIQRHSNALR